jgi:hypothetical protein
VSIHINATATLAKTFSVKREKQADDSENVVAHLKIADVAIDRDQIDVLCGQPVGWSTGALFDELGAPRARLSLSLVPRARLTLSGVIDGGKKPHDPQLKLKEADVDAIVIDLTNLGALLCCQLSWTADGDEVNDVADMLGKVCNINVTLQDGAQGDLLAPLKRLAQQDGIDSIKLVDVAGKTVAEFRPKRAGMPVSSASEAMKLLDNGWKLKDDGGGLDGTNFELISPDGKTSRGIWINAARSCLKRGLLQSGGDNVDGFIYVSKRAA